MMWLQPIKILCATLLKCPLQVMSSRKGCRIPLTLSQLSFLWRPVSPCTQQASWLVT